MNRRRVLRMGAAALAAPLLARCGIGATAAQITSFLPTIRLGASPLTLIAQEKPFSPTGRESPLPAWIYGDRPFPVLRATKGQPVSVHLENHLREHTSVHWHGLRIPNAMDGVPYVTQPPVQPGQSFDYAFTPPDSGTYFFHPHCDTAQQLGRGLAGILMVDGDAAAPFDDDVVCVIKDWRDAGNGKFLPFITLKGAGRAGTFGTLRTVNGVVSPTIAVRKGANIRVRLINVDSTRICELGIEGADAHVIAIDGNAVTPFKFATWRLGPAMRIDLAIQSFGPAQAKIVDYFAAEPVTLATLAIPGYRKRSRAPDMPTLRPNAIPEADLARATKHQLTLGASANPSNYPDPPPLVLPGGKTIDLTDNLCLATRTLWALDGKSWPQQGHKHLPPPLLHFKRGEHVLLEWFNTTPHSHPMHIHGHTMKVLSASLLKRPVHHADTVLVMPNERVQVAFVADNPGNWMIHCHIIEHQETGMMAWFKVA